MSQYQHAPLDFAGLKTVSLYSRGGKVTVADFAKPYEPGSGIAGLLDSLPKILAADTLRTIAAKLREAKAKQRAIIWGIGGHVIKCGLAPTLLDLARRGYATAFAMNA